MRIRETDHRIANSLSLAGTLLRMQRERERHEEVRTGLLNAEARLASIARFHRFIAESAENGADRIDLTEYLQTVLPAIGESIGIRCTLAVSASDPLDAPVETARALSIIVNELALNAQKHAYDGNPAGVLTVELDRGEGRCARLKVSDGGPGLDGADPGHDGLDGGGHDSGGGGGLGMTIVRSFVQTLDGTLAWHNDGGAVFTITVPLE
jgi:two-component sensor histidine kinase